MYYFIMYFKYNDFYKLVKLKSIHIFIYEYIIFLLHISGLTVYIIYKIKITVTLNLKKLVLLST